MSDEDLEPWEVAWLAAAAWFSTHGYLDFEDAWTEDTVDAPPAIQDFFGQVAAAVLVVHGGRQA